MASIFLYIHICYWHYSWCKVDRMERQRQDIASWSRWNRLFEEGCKVEWRCQLHLWTLQTPQPSLWSWIGMERHCVISFKVEHPTGAQVLNPKNWTLEMRTSRSTDKKFPPFTFNTRIIRRKPSRVGKQSMLLKFVTEKTLCMFYQCD